MIDNPRPPAPADQQQYLSGTSDNDSTILQTRAPITECNLDQTCQKPPQGEFIPSCSSSSSDDDADDGDEDQSKGEESEDESQSFDRVDPSAAVAAEDNKKGKRKSASKETTTKRPRLGTIARSAAAAEADEHMKALGRVQSSLSKPQRRWKEISNLVWSVIAQITGFVLDRCPRGQWPKGLQLKIYNLAIHRLKHTFDDEDFVFDTKHLDRLFAADDNLPNFASRWCKIPCLTGMEVSPHRMFLRSTSSQGTQVKEVKEGYPLAHSFCSADQTCSSFSLIIPDSPFCGNET